MKFFVVIDTNVIVSSLLSKHPDASTVQVIDALFDSRIIPLYNDEILHEYENVLRRPKFGFSEETIRLVIHSIRDNGLRADRLISDEIFPDPNDRVFYEVCMAKREEDSMLVTGNIRHFPAKPYIVTPNELINIINRSSR